MPISYRVEPAIRLIRSKASGVLTEGDSHTHYTQMSADPEFQPTYRQLCDLQDVTDIQLSTAFLQALALSPLFSKDSRRAFVAPTDLYFGLARMVQAFSELEGREAGVFRTVEEAETWLGISVVTTP